jgi:hypothetical protein
MCTSLFFYKKIDDFSEKYANLINKTRYWGLLSKPGGSDVLSTQFSDYGHAILDVFKEYEIPLAPIVTNMDFGHSDPIWVMPYSGLVEINPREETVTLLEGMVR